MTRVRREESFAESAAGPGADTTLRRAAAANLNMIGAEIQLTAAASGVVPDDTFTVTQAINSIGFGRFQIVLSIVVGLCWMADSMEMIILSSHSFLLLVPVTRYLALCHTIFAIHR